MVNPAEYLLKFFKVEPRIEGFDDSACSAFDAMARTERLVAGLKASGVRRLDTVEQQLPAIWESLWKSFADAYSDGSLRYFSTHPKHDETLSPASILSLQTIADRSFSMRYELNDDRAKNLTAFLNELVELIKSDDSLPPALKAHIMKLVDEVRRNIDNFEAGIDFNINDSLQRLFGSMYMAESATQEKSKWQTIKDKYLGNMLADFIVQLPALGLAVSQTLQAIGS